MHPISSDLECDMILKNELDMDISLTESYTDTTKGNATNRRHWGQQYEGRRTDFVSCSPFFLILLFPFFLPFSFPFLFLQLKATLYSKHGEK